MKSTYAAMNSPNKLPALFYYYRTALNQTPLIREPETTFCDVLLKIDCVINRTIHPVIE